MAELQGQLTIFLAQLDPDALAMALGLDFHSYKIRGENHVASRIVYGGPIGHAQNRAIVNRYDLGRFLREASMVTLAKNVPTALVDSSLLTDARLNLIEEYPPSIIIDHHRDGEFAQNGDNFVLVDEVGAGTTLVHELIEACQYTIPFEFRYLKVVMALGIYTDTKGLIACDKRDISAYQKLVEGLSAEELAPLLSYKLSPMYFVYLQKALELRKQQGSRLVTGMGFISEQDSDQLAEVADEFLRMDGVSLVVVWGIIGNRVRISARSSNLSEPLGDFLKKHFTKHSGAKLTPDGRGEGGAMMELDLGVWLKKVTEPLVLEMVKAWMEDSMFTV